MTDPTAWLAQGAALSAAATPGPWVSRGEKGVDGADYADVIAPGRVACMAYCYGGTSTIEGDRLDADLSWIADARTRVDRLTAFAQAVVALVAMDAYDSGYAPGSWEKTGYRAALMDVRALAAEYLTDGGGTDG